MTQKEQIHTTDFDDVIASTGYVGRYHIMQAFLQMFVGVSVAYPLLSIVFIGYEAPHKCSSIENTTNNLLYGNFTSIQYRKCDILLESNNSGGEYGSTTLPCIAGHNYTLPKQVTMLSSWDLVCDRAGLAELSQTIMMLGQGVGGILFTTMADKYGRKPLYMSSLFGLWALGIGLAFSPNIMVYIAIRFFIGGFQQGAGLCAYTLFVEMLTSKHRPIAGSIGGLVWSLSVMSLAPIAYAMKDLNWIYLQIILSCASLYVFILPFLLDESPRWLIANNRYDEAKKVLKRAARMNKADPKKVSDTFDALVALELTQTVVTKHGVKVSSTGEEMDDVLLVNGDETKTTSDKIITSDKKLTILDLFRHKRILITSAITWYIWTVNSITYYGLFLTSSSLAGDRFINFFMSCIVEIPATITVFIALKKLGRRQVAMLYHFMAGAALIISVVILAAAGDTKAGGIAANAFNLFGKFAITGSFNSLFIYCPELFPTNLRTAGLGMGSAMSRIGGMTAPYSKQLIDIVKWGPGAIFGTSCLIASFMIRYLPETKGKELPTTIDEINEMYKSSNKHSKLHTKS